MNSMRESMMGFLSQGLQAELIYSFVLIAICLMIYFSTKEMYELTKHRGIKYFRYSFLFFSLAFFFRSFIKFFYLRSLPFPNIFPDFFLPISHFLFFYFSFTAILYLTYSLWHKKIKYKEPAILILIFSVVMAILSISMKSVLIIFFIQIILFAFLGMSTYKKHKKSKKKNNLYIIYTLLFGFWIINIIDILIPNFFRFYQLLIYFVSISIFLSILYKVLKKVGS